MKKSKLTNKNCNCFTMCRDWGVELESEGLPANYPPFEHHPTCQYHKMKDFYQISMDGSTVIVPATELNTFLENEDSEIKIKPIRLTEDQFYRLNEFVGF